jgi:hypothetical protein
MLRFANRELDLSILRVGCNAGEQGAQLFERVGLELGEVRIHVGAIGAATKALIIAENRSGSAVPFWRTEEGFSPSARPGGSS